MEHLGNVYYNGENSLVEIEPSGLCTLNTCMADFSVCAGNACGGNLGACGFNACAANTGLCIARACAGRG